MFLSYFAYIRFHPDSPRGIDSLNWNKQKRAFRYDLLIHLSSLLLKHLFLELQKTLLCGKNLQNLLRLTAFSYFKS